MLQNAQDAYIELEEKIIDILIEQDKKEIEETEKKYDALKKADDDYLNALRDNINKRRAARDKEDSYKDLAKKEKRGIEETGRKIRYEFFDEIANKIGAKKIVTAHNNNDKVETIIMNILRGSGTSGLKGFLAIRNQKYIRPLIECKREEIEKYCIENNLNPKFDKSNNDNTYIRNKIRNIVIPYIKKEFNPNILNTINRLSEVVEEEDIYINKIVEEKYEELILESDIKKEQIILDLKKFNNLELVIKRKLILYTINELLGTTDGIEKVNIDDIIKLCSNNIGNKFLKPTNYDTIIDRIS
jgi:tRNA(Ile)-lysidine synthase